MKITIRHHFVLGLLILTALFSLVPREAFAAGESAYLTPASGTTQPGNTFTVSVDGYVSSKWFGSGSGNADGTINYPANLLKIISTSSTGASYPNAAIDPNNTTGKLTYSLTGNWWTGPVNQTVHLFTITFQTLAVGAADVSFGSATYDTGTGTAVTTGGRYMINAPPVPTPAPTPTPTPTPKPSVTPTPTPKPSVKPTSTPPSTPTPSSAPAPSSTPTPEETPAPVADSDGGLKITEVKVVATRLENSVNFKVSNSDTVTTISYGTSKSSLKNEATVAKQTDGSYKAVLPDLKSGTLYYFSVKASTADSLQGATYSGTLSTRGYPVQLTIQQNNLLIPDAKVTIDGRNFVANKDAIITTELGDGSHKASIVAPGATGSHEVSFTVIKKSIPTTGNPDQQNFVLNATVIGTASGINSSIFVPAIAGGSAVVATTAGVVGFALVRRRRSSDTNSGVDTDMLAANYGSAIDNRDSHTPMPNLETSNISTAPASNDYPEEPLEQAFPVADMSSQEPYSANVVDQPIAIDPAALPLPPATDSQQIIADNNEQSTSRYSEVEQLAPEISSIEAAEPLDPNAASAVYHDDTGELDIIHHKPQEDDTNSAISDEYSTVSPVVLDTPILDSDESQSLARASITPMDQQPLTVPR